MLNDIGASEHQFILAAKKGLHSKENRKYFEQLIACDNFIYFKNMMVKKNLQLEEQAYKLLHENIVKKTKLNLQSIINNDKDYQKHQEKKEKMDQKAENEMEKVVDEEKQKLIEMKEFEDIKKAFDFSKKKDLVAGTSGTTGTTSTTGTTVPMGVSTGGSSSAKPEEEEISLYSANNLKDSKSLFKILEKLKPIVGSKSADPSAKETLKQLEKADKDKKPLYVSPVKKIEEKPKEIVVEEITKKPEKVDKTADKGTTDSLEKKSNVKPIVEQKIEYVAPDISTMNFEDKAHSEMKKKLEADLQSSVKDSKQLENQYDQLQKDKENKLKEYRDMIVKMKKDKRNINKTKELDPEVSIASYKNIRIKI